MGEKKNVIGIWWEDGNLHIETEKSVEVFEDAYFVSAKCDVRSGTPAEWEKTMIEEDIFLKKP